MASSSVQGMTSSSSSSPPQYMYDVFLSFRGKDTRNNFTSHLYSNLAQRGIVVYMDDRELERGKTIEPALWKAIEESRFSVIIISRDYASSPWCLDELVKIVQCMKEMGQTVLPVFYDVDPSEVTERKRKYEEAFGEHEQNFKENLEKVRIWKNCLSTVANLSGWDIRNRNESESIKRIAKYISYKLSVTLPTISKKLVGIDSRVEVLNGFIGEEVGEAIFIGICGMGGIGKTTIARVVYDSFRWQFKGSCFLANVREVFAEKDGPRRLQKQLLYEILMVRANICDSSRGIEMIKRRLQHKKILVVLDDVDDHKQLESLAAESKWFGPGSRIIITSRDKHVLTRNGVARIYEAEKLNDDDALMLFSQKAFENDQPAEDFLDLSKQVVGYANGLPLALEVIGSFLYGRRIPEWRGAINRMNEIPDDEIIKVLLVSFDGLHELEKKIFLDIACFLKGFKIDRITRILDGWRGFHTGIGIPVLIERSLISVSRDQVWMHNLLQKMGQEIIRRESPDEPGRRSRLWTYEDVCLALIDNTGKEKIEAIFLDMPGIKEAQWNMKAFSKMSRLRLLKIDNMQLSEGPEDLSNNLRFLEWHSYPSKSLPAGLQVDELVELHMANSNLEQLWYGCKIRIYNILEKTRKKKEKANDSKNGVEGESPAVMKEQENLRKKVADLIIVKGKDDSKPWNADARDKLGSRLIELLLQTKYGVIQCDPLVLKGLEKTARHMVIPYMPMLVPPLRWRGYDKGAHLFLPSYVMWIHGAKQQREAVKRAPRKQLQAVFEALDTLGNTKWSVNKRVLSVLDRIWSNGCCLADLVDHSDVDYQLQPQLFDA